MSSDQDERLTKRKETGPKAGQAQGSAPAATAAPAELKGSWLSARNIGLVLVLYMVGTYGYSFVKPKDPSLVHFSNSMADGQEFEVEIVAHEFENEVYTSIYNTSVLEYSLGGNRSSHVLNVTLNSSLIKANPERFRLEVVVRYGGEQGKSKKLLNCYSDLTQLLEVRRKSVEFEDGTAGKSTGSSEHHVLTRLYFLLAHDTNVYDFTENPILNYLYRRRPVPRSEAPKGFMGHYDPHLDCSQYWVLRRDKVPVSSLKDNDKLVIRTEIETAWIQKALWVFKFAMAEQQTSSLLHDQTAFEDLKMILSDNSHGYLFLLFSVNLLHVLFSYLSLKSNISFWTNLKSSEGLSTRKYYTDVIFQLVVFLYLVDNEASFVLTILTGIEVLVAVFIALKMTRFEARPDGRFPFYQLPAQSKGIESETEVYDRQATRFMSYLFLPVLLVYTCYSFVNRAQLSLYSFLLKTVVSIIYAIGFINMTPQIYINYKLKSVEHMPWKSMIYQFLNTIIDDLFAFAVKMPTLQRLSVFRDDVIFVIYLTQMWLYRKNKRSESASGEQKKAD